MSDTDFSYLERAMPFEKGEQQNKPRETETEESCRAKAKKKLSDTSRHHLVVKQLTMDENFSNLSGLT